MFSPSSADLEAAYRTARRNWFRLCRTENWMTDPVKRRRMLAARVAYQDAKLRLLLAASRAERFNRAIGPRAEAEDGQGED